jgi:uncharacterized protein YbaA (DUF1428 family)
MTYVDGFVIPIPKKNLAAYRRMARWGCRVWMKHGALAYKECVGNDLKTHCGRTFGKQLKLKAGETVVFAFIVFNSRAHRDRVNKAVMKAMTGEWTPKNMPFDPDRMVYGGFKTIVER